MINKLSLDDRGDDMTFVSAVAGSLFADGTTNWGRIASLLAFGAVVCQYLKERGRLNCVELVSQEISTYLLSDQRDWMVKNNSWVSYDLCLTDRMWQECCVTIVQQSHLFCPHTFFNPIHYAQILILTFGILCF